MYTIIPTMLDFSSFSEVAQAERSLSKIANTIKAVSSYGPGTNTTLYTYLPAGNISYTDDKFIVYKMSTKDGTTNIVQKVGVSVDITDTEFENGGIKCVTISKEIEKVSVVFNKC